MRECVAIVLSNVGLGGRLGMLQFNASHSATG